MRSLNESLTDLFIHQLISHYFQFILFKSWIKTDATYKRLEQNLAGFSPHFCSSIFKLVWIITHSTAEARQKSLQKVFFFKSALSYFERKSITGRSMQFSVGEDEPMHTASIYLFSDENSKSLCSTSDLYLTRNYGETYDAMIHIVVYPNEPSDTVPVRILIYDHNLLGPFTSIESEARSSLTKKSVQRLRSKSLQKFGCVKQNIQT